MVLYNSHADAHTTDTMGDDCRKSLRPIRNRRYTRRSFGAGNRPPKRLFTPEIKRYLKDWLVRRRENPYPNREEKKLLSQETGLTYIQICNWFANWRRKLKNVNADRNEKTWGHLIRSYNDQAQGNVEQFSICSDDSIWSEPVSGSHDFHLDAESPDRSPRQIAYYAQDLTSHDEKLELINNNSFQRNSNIEKSMDLTEPSPLLLSKWLESAARFQPSENNYSCRWAEDRRRRAEPRAQRPLLPLATRHGQDEVEAAVALTTLATAASRIVAP